MGRKCSRVGCQELAVATLTFVYADSTAVLGPLSPTNEPGTYDLCDSHAERTQPPVGWELINLPRSSEPPEPDHEDLLKLADAIREIGLAPESSVPAPASSPDPSSIVELGRRAHLRVLADADQVHTRLG